MAAFFDDSCPKCRRRFGWQGELTDRPACPKCGHQVPRAELEAGQKEMDDFQALLLTRADRSTGPQLARKRVTAGLSLRQAAKLLGLQPKDLADWENGRATVPADQAPRLDRLYAGDTPDLTDGPVPPRSDLPPASGPPSTLPPGERA